jgi:hypothetical protein
VNKQVDVNIISADIDTAPVRARWLICDNGMTVADGEADYHVESGVINWIANAPPSQYYADVMFEIDRSVKRRKGQLGT